MTAPTYGPCESWTDDCAVRVCAPGLDPEYDLTDVISYVSETLFILSGRQFPGTCTATVRPCFGPNCGCGAGDLWLRGWDQWEWSWPSLPFLEGGEWSNIWICGGGCAGRCDLPKVRLAGPITGVTQVLIDGEEFTDYSIEDFRYLVRTDGHRWPCSQDLRLPATEPDTFQITWEYGRPVPPGGRYAASVMVAQFALARCGGDGCTLPANVVSLAREGVALSFEDTSQLWTDGKVGIREVDLWLEAVNPGRAKRRAGVYRADDRRRNRRFT